MSSQMAILSTVVFSLLVLVASAVPKEYNRDILDLIHGDTNTSTPTKTWTTSTSFFAESTTRSMSSSMSRPTLQPNATVSVPTNTTVGPTPTVSPVYAESQPTDHSSKTWQVIGIVIIAILFIATSIACAMFFDRLWKFFRDVVCCTPRPLVSEEFIQDCDTQWDTKTVFPSSPDRSHDTLCEKTSVYTRTRELPWNTDTQDWATVHRQPSRRNDHPAV